MSNKVLALIPARRGSKGVPGKNMRSVGGMPLIEFSLLAAAASKSCTTIAVSSDDETALALAERHGALALRRPEGISEDASPVTLAVRSAFAAAQAATGLSYDVVVLLQPTAPLRKGADIDAAVSLYREHGNAVCSVSQCDDNHPARMYRIAEDRLQSLMPELAQLRRQDLPPIYLRNGALYVFGPQDVADGTIIKPNMTPYVMPLDSAINIDHELDLLLLDAYLKQSPWTF